MSKASIKKTEAQKKAVKIMGSHSHVLLEGGGRAGKTFIILYTILVRAIKYPGTRHLIARLRFNHAKASICYDTMPKIIEILGISGMIKLNKSDWYYELENGSSIWIGGLDEKERIEKILGNEYSTIFLNEASQISFDAYEIVLTRLNPPDGVKPLLVIDYNPPSTRHWGYKIFHEGTDPVTGQPLVHPDRYAMMRINPGDNLENLSTDYIQTLEGMSEAKRKRFLYGEYTDSTEGALWQWDWIANNRVKEFPDLTRVVVAVDPAVTGTDTSDDTGIVIVGRSGRGQDTRFYVLADHTYHGSVTGWADEVVRVYNKYQADCVVGEVNQGGDLVEANIRNAGAHVAYRPVRATRGKAVRAEPIADLYRRGLVHHVGVFNDLEFQMTHWTPEDKDSPDNMDALVWGISHLMRKGGEMSLSSV